MKKIILPIAIGLLLGLAILLIFRQEDSSRPIELRPAPEFSLKDYSGREVKLADFRGQNAIINSWAAWCPFCKKELPDFASVKKEFGDQITVVAIDRGESLEVAKRYSDELGVTNDLIFLLDPDDSFYQSIGGFSMPETIFVDKEGLIRDHKRGPMDREEFRRRVQQAFKL